MPDKLDSGRDKDKANGVKSHIFLQCLKIGAEMEAGRPYAHHALPLHRKPAKALAMVISVNIRNSCTGGIFAGVIHIQETGNTSHQIGMESIDL